MNQTNTVMLAILVALATTTGLVTALSSVATPAHAKVNSCPTSQLGGGTCFAGGGGQQGGGAGARETRDLNTQTFTISGGQGHVGGEHAVSDSGGVTCVGSACT
ncbi:MAG: hypothetical protein ACJ71K_05250 [Nitrososphaeraceae archaeon]|jgi:hypothetical protein